jgi:hypothetical protein
LIDPPLRRLCLPSPSRVPFHSDPCIAFKGQYCPPLRKYRVNPEEKYTDGAAV